MTPQATKNPAQNPKTAEIYKLYELYLAKSFGVDYIAQCTPQVAPSKSLESSLAVQIKSCHLCARSKLDTPKLDYVRSDSVVVFVSEFAMGDMAKPTKSNPQSPSTHSANFSPFLFDSKGAQMLQNIAQNVFKTDKFSVLSLLKCATRESTQQEREACKPYLISQLSKSPAKAVVLFGEVVCESVLGLDFSHKGVALDLLDKKAIATYSLSQLLRNPSLKKQTLAHLHTLLQASPLNPN